METKSNENEESTSQETGETTSEETTEEYIARLESERDTAVEEAKKATQERNTAIVQKQKIRDKKDTENDGDDGDDSGNSSNEDNLTTNDIYSLIGNNINQEHNEIVRKIAKASGLSITDALKDPDTRSIIDARIDRAVTASAMNTDKGTPSSTVKPADVLNQARNGKFSDKDSDIDKLIDARLDEQLG